MAKTKAKEVSAAAKQEEISEIRLIFAGFPDNIHEVTEINYNEEGFILVKIKGWEFEWLTLGRDDKLIHKNFTEFGR